MPSYRCVVAPFAALFCSAVILLRQSHNLVGNTVILRGPAHVETDALASNSYNTSLNNNSKPHDINNTTKRNGIVILGMHRSGTSMLSGLLVEGCGYQVGSPLIQPGPANQKGFYELVSVVYQNDYFMEEQNVDWHRNVLHFDAHVALRQLHDEKVNFKYGKRALDFYNDENNTPWLQKDPRMYVQCVCISNGFAFLVASLKTFVSYTRRCITLPTWLHLLDSEPAIVFTYRHPLQVAQSLYERNDMELKNGLRLWIMYNMRAIQNSRGHCRVVTSNTALLLNPFKEVTRIRNELTSKCGVLEPPATLTQEVVNEFVDPTLQQHDKKKKKSMRDEEDGQIIAKHNDGTCIVYDYKSQHDTTSQEYHVEMLMYREAMRIYCDLESGKAYEANYEW